MSIIYQRIVSNLGCTTQIQPFGIDLTLKQITRCPSTTVSKNDPPISAKPPLAMLQPKDKHATYKSAAVHLSKGAYLVEFNEHLTVPERTSCSLRIRDKALPGASLDDVAMTEGYDADITALLTVETSDGLLIFQDARCIQLVIEQT